MRGTCFLIQLSLLDYELLASNVCASGFSRDTIWHGWAAALRHSFIHFLAYLLWTYARIELGTTTM
jgi:hypothetical protein